jgi:hypothetical protein
MEGNMAYGTWGKRAPVPAPARRADQHDCFCCGGGWAFFTAPFEHDGKVDYAHPTCIGGWLMGNPDSVISFAAGHVA